MPKFNKTEEEIDNLFDKWLYVLKFLPKFQERPKILKEHIFNKLFQVAELAKLTPAEVRSYEESLKAYRDNINVVDTARKKGLKEGLARGKREGKAEVAKSLSKMGLPLAQIIEATGLSETEITQILK
jgi:predicted transposase/invertase (TIGR01784 family)